MAWCDASRMSCCWRPRPHEAPSRATPARTRQGEAGSARRLQKRRAGEAQSCAQTAPTRRITLIDHAFECRRDCRTFLLLDCVLDLVAGLFHLVADLLRRVVYLLAGFFRRPLFARGQARDGETQHDRRCNSGIEFHECFSSIYLYY